MKIVNRRSFLKSSASAAGMLSIAGPLSSRMGQAQTSSPNLSIYTACSNVHALTAADWGTSNVNGQDYVNSGNAINALVADWKANGFDQQTQPLWQRMTPSML